MGRTPLAILLLAAAAAATAPAAELGPARPTRQDAWRVIGPGGGGTMRRPAISPHDPQVVLLGCDMTGGYVTGDGGASWRMINFGSVPTAFAFDPATPSTVYAGAEAVYRSDDAGRTWRMVLPDPAKNTVAKAIGDHGDRVFFTDDPAYPGSGRSVTIHAIAVDEDDSNRVFAAASAADSPVPGTPASPTLLLGSTDGGRTWARVAAFGSERVFALRAHGGGTAPRVNALAATGVYEGPGPSLQHVPAPGGARFTSGSFGRDPRSGVVFAYATLPLNAGPAGIAGGVQVSDDGGRTWRGANGSLLEAVREVGRGDEWGPAKGSRPSLGPIAVSARFPLVAYVGLRGILLPDRGDAPFNGIAKTVDGGRTWSIVHAESDQPSPNLAGSWIEPRAAEDGHSVWFDSPYDLAVAPGDPDVAYATDLFRAYRTTDGGKTWAQVNSELARERSLDHPRPRRHDHVRDPVRPARPAARVHPVHRHRPLPERGRRRDLDRLLDRRPDALAQHDVLARVRPRGEGPDVGWLQRDARPAAPEDVAAHRPGTVPGRRRRLDRRGPPLDGLQPGHGGVGDHARAPRPEEPEGQPHAVRGRVRPGRLQVHRRRPLVDVEERRPRSRPAEPALRVAAHPRAGRCALPRGRAAQRAREDRRPGRWCPLPLDRRRGALAGPPAAGRHERAERSHRRPGRPEAALPLGVGGDAPGRRHGRRHLPQHGRRRHVASRLHRGAARLRRDDRSPRSEADVRRRLRPGRVPLRRPRRDVDADPGLQLQVGPARDPRPEGRLEGLRHHLRRQRVARPRGRRSRRHGGRRPGFLSARAARRGEHPRHARVPGGPGEEGRQGRRGLLLAGRAHRRAARRAGDAPGRPDEGGREGGARLGGGKGLGLRSEDRPRAAPRLGPRALRHPARERLHPVARRSHEGPAGSRARHREPPPDEPRGGARRRSPPGAVRLLRRPRAARLRGTARPAGHRRGLPGHGPGARGKDLCLAVRHRRGRVADRRAQELELGREEPRGPGRQGAGRRAARGAGREGPRAPDQGPAPPADRGDRPLLHDAAPLVDARRVRADRDRDLRAREPRGRVPAVRGGRADLDPGAEPLLRRRRGLEAAAGAARGDEPQGRGRRELPPSRTRLRRGGSEGAHLRRRARSRGNGRGAPRPGARGGARDGHDRDRGEPPPGGRPRARPLPLPRRHSHDGALPSPDGEGVAEDAGGSARSRRSRQRADADAWSDIRPRPEATGSGGPEGSRERVARPEVDPFPGSRSAAETKPGSHRVGRS